MPNLFGYEKVRSRERSVQQREVFDGRAEERFSSMSGGPGTNLIQVVQK